MRERVIDPVSHTVYKSLPEFLDTEERPSGILTVMHGGMPIDVLHDPRGFNTTTVFFQAAVTRPDIQFPVFSGRMISAKMPTNRVHIGDPSLYLSKDLGLGWYAGNRYQALQDVLTEIICHLIPDCQRIVLFGASGGGFAALYYASRLPGALAVPVNPQTNLARYRRLPVDRYGRLAWGLEGERLCSQIPAVTDLVTHYKDQQSTRVWYVQNTGDSTHLERQFTPFMDGLTAGHSVTPVLIDGPEGHRPPPRPQLTAVLAAAVEGDDVPSL